jgi:hypothetical protein
MANGTDSVNVNGNGNGNPLAGLPPWARFVAVVGVPSAIAVYLIWVTTSSLSMRVEMINDRLSQHAEVTSGASARLNEFVQADEQYSRVVLELMQRICLNTASNETERSACLSVLNQGGGRR